VLEQLEAQWRRLRINPTAVGAARRPLAGGRVLGKPCGRRQPRDIDWMYELLAREGIIDFATRAVREGIIDFATRAVRDFAVAAERELERAYRDAAEGPDKEFIRGLVAFGETQIA
jgi:hypothetical protein